MTAGPELAAWRRAASKPRGLCAAALRCRSGRSAAARRSVTSSRVCARILSSWVDILFIGKALGAEEGTRTPTPLRVHGPEPCASANSATSALLACLEARWLDTAVIESLVLQRRCALSIAHRL